MREIGLLPNGCMLFVEDNKAGGRTYFSDEISCGVMVWDTCLVDEVTLLAAIVEENRLRIKEYHERKKKNEI